ncbi:MAG: lactonase family protein [Solirubrobacteraceae bacterium]
MRVVLAVCVLGVAQVAYAAATGVLTQKPASVGCVSDTGTGPCADGTALDGASSVTVSPDGRNAYVTSALAVTVFDRASDGRLAQKLGTAACISDTCDGPCADGTALDSATSVTVSPDGRSAYVTSSFTSSAVAVFDRTADGSLTQKAGTAGCISDTGAGPCVDGRALSAASSVAISPDGRSAYVTASAGSDAVAVFDRAADGTLTQKPGTAGCVSESGAGPCVDGAALSAASSVTVSPDGRSAYVTSAGSDAVAVLDRAPDGTLTQKPGTAACISDSGAGPCADGRALIGASSVAVSRDGRSAYVASLIRTRTSTEGAVAVFDRAADGTLTQKPGVAGCVSETGAGPCADGRGLLAARSVAVSPDGRNAYVAADTSGAVAVFDRAADGTLTQPGGAAGCISDTGAGPCADGTGLDGAASVAISPDGRSAYVAAFRSDAVSVFDRASDGTPPRPPAPPDTIRPRLTALSLSPSRFRAARTGPGTAARVGARVTYRLSEPAIVSFRVVRIVAGRRVRHGGRCVKVTRSNRGAKRCAREVTLRGAFTRRGAAGPNAFAFRGRLHARGLRPGCYRLRVVATDSTGNASRTARSHFTIVQR